MFRVFDDGVGFRYRFPKQSGLEQVKISEELTDIVLVGHSYAGMVITGVADRLERHYRDMQDIEFTVEQGKLYMLQTRNGKRTAQAALKLAPDRTAARAGAVRGL